MDSWLVFRRNRVILNQWTKWNNRSIKWLPKTSLVRCFPIRQEILNVSQISKTFHGICPPIFILTWLQQYSRRTFFHSAQCSLSNPICLWSVWCRRTMIPRKIFTGFAKFQGIVSVNDFRFPIWLQELLQAPSCFLRSFILDGYDWIHWVANSCTTTACRWLCRDSQFSLRTLWSAVIKSPKLSARGTAPPLRLLHGALVIMVLCQILQFRSSGKWVKTLCPPKSTLLVGVGSKDGSREELACESLRSGTLSSTRFSLNSCNHSGMSEHNGSPRSVSWFSSLFGFGFLVGLVNGSPRSIRSTLNLTQVLDGNLSHSDLPVLESHCRLTQLWLVKWTSLRKM